MYSCYFFILHVFKIKISMFNTCTKLPYPVTSRIPTNFWFCMYSRAMVFEKQFFSEASNRQTGIGATNSTYQRGWHINETLKESKKYRCHPRWKPFVCLSHIHMFSLSLSYSCIEAHQATVDQWQCCNGRVWYRWFQTGLLQLPTISKWAQAICI